MRYYIAEKGQPVGPFEPNELLAHGLTANSLVCGEGMPSWTSASQVPELMALLTGQPVDMTGTGGADAQLPQVPPMGSETSLPQMPPMGGNVITPELPQMPTPQAPTPQTPLPQVPPITNPAPTAPTTTNSGGSTLPNSPLPFPETGSTTTNQQQVAPKTWLLNSILATVVSCFICRSGYYGLIPGVIAIFNAWGAKTCIAKGNIEGANKKSAKAKKWSYITLAVGAAFAFYGAYLWLTNQQSVNEILSGKTPFFLGLPW